MILHRDLWRLGFGLAFADVSSTYSKRLRDSDGALRQQVIKTAERLQRLGKLREDLDCEVFGAALYNNANAMFLEFAWSESSTFEELIMQIRKMSHALIDLALPAKPNSSTKT